jgi:rubrerythrin
MDLKGSKTAENLKDALSGESRTNHRYLYFPAKAIASPYRKIVMASLRERTERTSFLL